MENRIYAIMQLILLALTVIPLYVGQHKTQIKQDLFKVEVNEISAQLANIDSLKTKLAKIDELVTDVAQIKQLQAGPTVIKGGLTITN
jgi:fumarate reductase subunit D